MPRTGVLPVVIFSSLRGPPESDEAADASLKASGADAHSLIESRGMREDAKARDRTLGSSGSL